MAREWKPTSVLYVWHEGPWHLNISTSCSSRRTRFPTRGLDRSWSCQHSSTYSRVNIWPLGPVTSIPRRRELAVFAGMHGHFEPEMRYIYMLTLQVYVYVSSDIGYLWIDYIQASQVTATCHIQESFCWRHAFRSNCPQLAWGRVASCASNVPTYSASPELPWDFETKRGAARVSPTREGWETWSCIYEVRTELRDCTYVE